MVGLSATQPALAGEGHTTDGMIRAGISYGEAGRYLNLYATMLDSTGEFTDRVYFTINESEYDMEPFSYDGKIDNALEYYYLLSGLNYGFYVVKFFHQNSTDVYEFKNNYTVNITAYEFNVVDSTTFWYNRMGNTNELRFEAYWNNEELMEEIEDVRLNIDGSSETMILDECTQKHYFTKDMGIHNENTYNFSISFLLDSENYQTANKSVWTYNYTETSDFQASLFPLYNPGTLDFNVYLSYRTWQNIEPVLILEVDGENQTLETKFIIPNLDQNIKWSYTQELGMYPITGLEAGVNHTINVHAFDGINWISRNLMDNETLATPPEVEDFSIEVINWETKTGDYSYTSNFEIEILVTCPYITDTYQDYARMSLYGPWTSDPVFLTLTPIDWNDDDFSDGKLYNLTYTNWWGKEGFGELTGNFSIFYHNITGSNSVYGHFMSSNYTFSISKTPVAEFGLNKQEWFVYETGFESIYRDSPYLNQEGSSYSLIRVVDFGYELGVNYLDLEIFNWNECTEVWDYIHLSNNDYFLQNYRYYNFSAPSFVKNVTTRIWINLEDNSTIEDWVFLPLGNISNYLEDFGQDYFEDNMKISSNSVEISANLGDETFSESILLNQNGFLEEYSMNIDYGNYHTYMTYTRLIDHGNGIIPEAVVVTGDNENAGLTAAIVILVSGISIGGVGLAYISNQFPKFNNLFDKFKKK
ncbi:MAG: hypothetical protein ACTSYI_10280 [Promethearchaeota archaeon]